MSPQALTRALTALLVTGLTACGAPQGTTLLTPNTPPAPVSAAPDPTTLQLLNLINTARAQSRTCGGTSYPAAPNLTYNPRLQQAAQAHASDMATQNYFSHTSLDGSTVAERITATGYNWHRLAENIAGGLANPQETLNDWLQSPGHCANIMNPNLKEIGLGYAYNASSTYRYYWVQDFGAP